MDAPVPPPAWHAADGEEVIRTLGASPDGRPDESGQDSRRRLIGRVSA